MDYKQDTLLSSILETLGSIRHTHPYIVTLKLSFKELLWHAPEKPLSKIGQESQCSPFKAPEALHVSDIFPEWQARTGDVL